MCDKLRCFDCGEKVPIYLELSACSRWFCDNCALEFDSDEITKYVTERRDNHTLLGSAEAAEQITEWKKVLDMISDCKQKEAARIEQLRRQAEAKEVTRQEQQRYPFELTYDQFLQWVRVVSSLNNESQAKKVARQEQLRLQAEADKTARNQQMAEDDHDQAIEILKRLRANQIKEQEELEWALDSVRWPR